MGFQEAMWTVTKERKWTINVWNSISDGYGGKGADTSKFGNSWSLTQGNAHKNNSLINKGFSRQMQVNKYDIALPVYWKWMIMWMIDGWGEASFSLLGWQFIGN